MRVFICERTLMDVPLFLMTRTTMRITQPAPPCYWEQMLLREFHAPGVEKKSKVKNEDSIYLRMSQRIGGKKVVFSYKCTEAVTKFSPVNDISRFVLRLRDAWKSHLTPSCCHTLPIIVSRSVNQSERRKQGQSVPTLCVWRGADSLQRVIYKVL